MASVARGSIKYHKVPPDVMIDRSSWCTVSIDGQEVRARIAHKGRGKFMIEDDFDGHYKGKVIDASDIINCNINRAPANR